MSSAVKDFFADQELFITGATGLLGKSLVEMILRLCPDVKRIFVLIREKKGKLVEQRLEEMKSSMVFDRLKKENPEALDKIFCINGDIMEIGLGICESDLELIKNVTIVYHAAATVRFDEPLKYSILMNIRGTQEALKISEKLRNLKLFFHISTAYSNPNEKYVKEEIYPAKANWETYVKYAEIFDNDQLNALEIKLLCGFPNTYTLTKHLAEQTVHDYRYRLPVSVYRPSIVHGAGTDPFPGWFDSFMGIMGVMAGIYSGLLRVLYCNPDICLDVIPVDEVCRSMLVSTVHTYKNPIKNRDAVDVYLCCSTNVRTISIRVFAKIFNNIAPLYAFNKTLWNPNFGVTDNIYSYYLQIYLFHCLPAMFLDGLLKLFGQKPFLLPLQRKIFSLQKSYRFFLFNEYKFETKKLFTILHEIDQYGAEFRYDSLTNKSTNNFAEFSLCGVRRFLLKEDDKSLPAARQRLKILKILDYTCKRLFLFYVGYWIYTTLISYLRVY